MANITVISKRLEGKVALITGGARGIGECTAKLFAAHGAKVIVADVKDELGHSLCDDVIGGSSASFVHCNVTVESDVKNAVDVALSKHGKLDIMHNNAGTINLEPNILDSTKEEFERVVKVNLVGPFLGMKHAARAMVPARSGSIVTTASVASTVAGMGTHAYTSSKHGVLGLMRSAAVDLGRSGVRINCVSPYAMATPLAKELHGVDEEVVAALYSTLKGKYCKAEDVAAAVVYLASDEAKYVSGLNLVVDGGFTIVNAGLSACGHFSN